MTETAPPAFTPASAALMLLVAVAVGAAVALAPELVLTWVVFTLAAVADWFATTVSTVVATVAGLVGAA